MATQRSNPEAGEPGSAAFVPAPAHASVHASLEPRALELLRAIANSPEPLGARELGRRIEAGNRPLSESTVNRLLRRLDEQGLTRSMDGRGRVVSEAGRALAQRAAAEVTWHQQIGSLEIRTVQDVRDLLVARRGVEREIVREAATSVSGEDVERLQSVMEEYERSVHTEERRRDVSTNFHKALASTVENTMLRAVAMVIFDPRFDMLEHVLDMVTAGRGTTMHSVHEHEEIMRAIRAGDPDAAEAAMVRHINRLIADASAVVAPSTRLAIELLLKNHSPVIGGGT
ncbi:FCD domain-containing protein [Microbispora triticiradicis]|uniref:FCD domain-containing protein n=1 Tax=Microbispora triticiradicis TaxID=2200763 RepID=UPI001404D636|nr:FCD domain-containing protein [Microbispora triticiradicis]